MTIRENARPVSALSAAEAHDALTTPYAVVNAAREECAALGKVASERAAALGLTGGASGATIYAVIGRVRAAEAWERANSALCEALVAAASFTDDEQAQLALHASRK